MKISIAHQTGQSLVEAVVAVAVVLLLVTGLIVATTASLRFSSLSKYRTEATNYAKEGMEQVRKLRDTSWQDFVSKSGYYCLSSTNVLTPLGVGEECPFNIANFYSRRVIFSYYAAEDGMRIIITVSWLEGKWIQSTVLSSYFTKWRANE